MDIYEQIYNRQIAGQPFVLATIVRTEGASPRKAGAKMLVHPDGKISGSIGGGNFENLVIEDCLGLLQSNTYYLLKKYSFVKGGAGATGMSCGGEAEVFMEVYGSPKKLIIFGGGHIGRDLAKLASGSEFQITVIDDRSDILNTYDQSVTTIQTDSKYVDNLPALDKNCYVVIVTRSHIIDQSILARVINEICAYIGMIGSKAKVANVLKNLQQSGVDKKLLDQVHAPIGLDIKGEGPYEIAISIMAEIIAVKNGITRSQS